MNSSRFGDMPKAQLTTTQTESPRRHETVLHGALLGTGRQELVSI